MADLNTQKVKDDLRKDINFYNEKISERAQNAESLDDQVELEQMRREKEKRQIDLENIEKDEENPNVLIK